ncbi:hypothetical protein CUJ83_13895 [Methanocella sp. CWC-04]|uniref:DUF7847 domain-containing protein n=1 Tax=Methanooceanicella nereidis TaxID=2052831 RepID=A0AAP2RG06_9EURY|nr:hypothetical protein [Methanocella sp. CWC-04]MCD1296091.1 hypothetical protein [Methanocella sp. CWC-04]
MGDFISILEKSVKGLANCSMLLLAGALVGILSLPGLLPYGSFSGTALELSGSYTFLIFPIIIMPLILSGSMGYALEYINSGSSSFSTFLGSIKKYYPKYLLASIVAFIIYYLLTTSLLLVLFSAGIAGDAFVASLMALVSLTIMFIGLMLIEFYDVCIITENHGVLKSFSMSVNFVKRNFAAVLPLFIIILILKLLVQFPLLMGMTAEFMTNETYMTNTSYMNATYMGNIDIAIGIPAMISVGIFQALIQAFVFAFTILYKMNFYITIRDRKRITDFDYDFSEETK